ncbi:MAG: hypothetical protein OXT64_01110 [Gammaproteobacteria bacterium]|nr:hypothetical protein [Gammaproteobacteria bacterium]
MKRIAFLTAPGESANDNRERLPAAFEAAGWRVAVLFHETLALTADGVAARDAGGRAAPLAPFDLIWILGLGARQTFLDRMQLLNTLDQARFVNTADAFVYLHGKFDLAEFGPETHASADVDALMEIVARGGRWVAKPTAGSFGRDVFLLGADDIHCRAVFEHLTGRGAGRYCLLQRYVEQAEHDEKRVIVAGGQIVGAYAKTGGNLATGAAARSTELDAAETALVRKVVAHLHSRGARFAGIDLAAPYVLEANVANPGGLGTLEQLAGVNPAPAVVEVLVRDSSRLHKPLS